MKNRESTKNQFVSLYNTESDAIFRYCFLRTSQRDVALDLTQDTFMRFWDSLIREKADIRNHRAFLFTVARNLIIDWYRKKKPQSLDALTEEDDSETFFAPSDSVRTDIEMESEGRYLISQIKELEPSYQQAVYLRFVEGLSPQEIADILGISVNAASVRVHRGLEQLRKRTGYSSTEL